MGNACLASRVRLSGAQDQLPTCLHARCINTAKLYLFLYLISHVTAVMVSLLKFVQPNVMVEWLTVVRILEVPGSYLGPETGFKLRLLWFSSVLPGEFWDSASNDSFFTHPYTKHSGWVVNITASYSGGTRLKSRPGDRLFWGILWFYSVLPLKCHDSTKN
jgi:hypothetical protein